MRLLFAAAVAVSVFGWTGANAAPFPVPSANMAISPTAANSASDPVEDSYQESASANCPSTYDCTMTFPATKYYKTLVSHVSCHFVIFTATAVAGAYLASSTRIQKNYVEVQDYGSLGGNLSSYVIDSQTYLFYSRGEQPTFTVTSTGPSVQNLSCTISGNYH
jgi:hypothetical protein